MENNVLQQMMLKMLKNKRVAFFRMIIALCFRFRFTLVVVMLSFGYEEIKPVTTSLPWNYLLDKENEIKMGCADRTR